LSTMAPVLSHAIWVGAYQRAACYSRLLGPKRAKREGLTNCKFQEGDASNLHELKDQSFGMVVSIFVAMFAPKPSAHSALQVC
jgi:hypothetical protein